MFPTAMAAHYGPGIASARPQMSSISPAMNAPSVSASAAIPAAGPIEGGAHLQVALFNTTPASDWAVLQKLLSQFGTVVAARVEENPEEANAPQVLVTFAEREAVVACVGNLVSLVPPELSSLGVRAVVVEVEQEFKLFVGMVPKGLVEGDLMRIFQFYGDIKEVHVVRHPSGQSKGCAFVKYYQHSAAVTAIDNLHGQLLTGSMRPLVVQFAEGKGNSIGRGGLPCGPGIGRGGAGRNPVPGPGLGRPHGPSGAVAATHPGATPGAAILSAHAGVGDPHNALTSDNSALRATSDDLSCMGFLGGLRSGTSAAAAAGGTAADGAAAAADHMYSSLHYALGGAGAGAGGGCLESLGSVGGELGSGLLDHAALYRNSSNGSRGSGGRNNNRNQHHHTDDGWGYGDGDRDRDERSSKYSSGREAHQPSKHGLPEDEQQLLQHNAHGSATTDLFIYHLPKEVTNQDLETLFYQFGTSMVSARVYVDRVTHESKGFGFVSYVNNADAEAAIRDMNGFSLGPKRLKVELKK